MTTIYYKITYWAKPTRFNGKWRGPEQYRRPPPNVARIISQEYEVIKRECFALGRDALWQDPFFPATHDSVFARSQNRQSIEWMRPRVSKIRDGLRLFGGP